MGVSLHCSLRSMLKTDTMSSQKYKKKQTRKTFQDIHTHALFLSFSGYEPTYAPASIWSRRLYSGTRYSRAPRRQGCVFEWHSLDVAPLRCESISYPQTGACEYTLTACGQGRPPYCWTFPRLTKLFSNSRVLRHPNKNIFKSLTVV